MNPLLQVFKNLSIGRPNLAPKTLAVFGPQPNRWYHSTSKEIPTPKPGGGKQYRRYVENVE